MQDSFRGHIAMLAILGLASASSLRMLTAPPAINGRMNRGYSNPPGTTAKNRARRKAERQRRRNGGR